MTVRSIGPVTVTSGAGDRVAGGGVGDRPLERSGVAAGDCSTARRASRIPSPQTLLSSAVPPHCRSSVSCAVWSSNALVASMSPISVRRGGPHQGDGARHVGRRHRGSADGAIGVAGEAAADVHAGGGDVGLDLTLEGRRPAAGEACDVVVDVEGAGGVALEIVTGGAGGAARGAGVAVGELRGRCPGAIQAVTMSRYQGSPGPPPQELLTTWGRRSGRGFSPLRSVGARTNCADERRAVSEQLLVSQPLAASQRAPGATPI